MCISPRVKSKRQFGIPQPRGLSQAIEGILKFTHQKSRRTGRRTNRQPMRKLHVYLLIQVTMQKCIVDSSWKRDHCLLTTTTTKHLTVKNLIIGEKVSVKSTPSTYVSPLTTNLALYLSTLPSALYLILQTYLQSIGFLPLGN